METKEQTPSWEQMVAYYDTLPQTGRWKILSYGSTKTGKTFFIDSLPGPVFVIDTDGSLGGLANPHVLTLSLQREAVLDGAPVYATIDDVLRKLLHKEGMFADNAIASLAIDGVTSLADLLLIELMNSSTVGGRKRDPLLQKATFDEYGVLGMLLETIFSKVDALTQHIYVTAGARTDTDQLSGAITGMPDVVGSFRQRIGHRFDAMLYTEADKDKFYAYARPHLRYPAGIRRWIGPERIENPTWAKIFEEQKFFIAPQTKGGPAS
jgi:hypothetical protein